MFKCHNCGEKQDDARMQSYIAAKNGSKKKNITEADREARALRLEKAKEKRWPKRI